MRRRRLVLLVVICLGHVMLISAQVQSRSGVPMIEQVAFGTLARLQGLAAGIADGVSGVWNGYFALRGVERDNEALRKQVLQLEGELQAERAKASRTGALEEALNLQQSLTARTLAARVIAGNPSPGALTVTIDRGALDGVEPNMAVIAGRGVVGRVIGRPSDRAALVQLLIDRSAAAAALLEKSGSAGIASGGKADGRLRLELVSPLVKVELGERVLTTGQDGIFPQGFVIGSCRVGRGQRQGSRHPSPAGRRLHAHRDRARCPRPPAHRARSVKLTAVVTAVLAAVILQVTLARYTVGGRWAFDLVLVGVIYVALRWEAVAGMIAGTVGGLLQDMLSGGIIGVGGLAKTLAGFAAGVIGTQLVSAKPQARAVIVAGATVLHRLVTARPAGPDRPAVARALVDGYAGRDGDQRGVWPGRLPRDRRAAERVRPRPDEPALELGPPAVVKESRC